MKKHERILEIAGEWKRDMQRAAEVRQEETGDVNYNAGAADGLLSAVKNLEERLEKAGFVGSKLACGQVKKMFKLPVLDKNGCLLCVIEIENEKLREFGNGKKLSIWAHEMKFGSPMFFENYAGNRFRIPYPLEIKMRGSFGC